MPTYEYACKACGHNFEIVQSFSEDALTTCPECAQEQLRKVYNAAGIIFKGDGWHSKDYGSSSSKTASKPADDDGSSSATDTGDSASTSGEKTSGEKTSGKKTSGGDATAKPAAS